MKTKLSKNVSFLAPFLKGLGKIVPISKVAYIRGYRVAKGLNEKADASIVRHSYSKYSINLKTQALVNGNKLHKYETLEKVLLELAHELAHLKDWNHSF